MEDSIQTALQSLIDLLRNADGGTPCAHLITNGPVRFEQNERSSNVERKPVQRKLEEVGDDRVGEPFSFEAWASERSLAQISRGTKRPQKGEEIGKLPDLDHSFDEVLRIAKQIESNAQAAKCPILGITGLLNAGKSSLLASFLSLAGQKRVLIGASNNQGTHRFVLWLPKSWESDSTLRSLLEIQLQTIFPYPPESLSSKTEIAARQYNGELVDHPFAERQREILTMEIPLLAWDENLDNAGLGIMDCPDIQSGMIQGLSEVGTASMKRMLAFADRRAEVLSKAIRLCAAFAVVVPSNSMRDALAGHLLTALRTNMPGLKRFLMINRVPRRYSTEEIQQEATQAYDRSLVDRTFMAYHFDGPEARERLPDPPATMVISPHQPLPVAFQISPGKAPQPPDAIKGESYFQNLSQHLDAQQLSRDTITSLVSQLQIGIREMLNDLKIDHQRRHDNLKRAWQALASGVLESSFGGSRGNGKRQLQLHASQEILQQIAASLERTAPWWAYPSVKVNQIGRSMKAWFAEAANKIPSFSWIGDRVGGAVDNVREKFRSGEAGQIVSARDLHQFVVSFDRSEALVQHPPGLEACDLSTRFQRAIDRFQKESQARLNEEQLDAFAQAIWAHMNWKQRIWQQVKPAALIFAPLLAVMALPIDFGGTSVLFLASVPEMLFAGFAGAGAMMLNRDGMPKVAEERAALQQAADLFAICCDELGMCRPGESELPTVSVNSQAVQLPDSPLRLVKSPFAPTVPAPFILSTAFESMTLDCLERLNRLAQSPSLGADRS